MKAYRRPWMGVGHGALATAMVNEKTREKTMMKEFPAILGLGRTALCLHLPAEAVVGDMHKGMVVDSGEVDNNILRLSLVPSDTAKYHFGAVRTKGDSKQRLINFQNGEYAKAKKFTGDRAFGASPAKAQVAEDGSRVDICLDLNLARPLLNRQRRDKEQARKVDVQQLRQMFLDELSLSDLVRELNKRVSADDALSLAIDTTTKEVVVRAEYR